MLDKFSLEDLLINIFPGGFFLVVIGALFFFEYPTHSIDMEKLKPIMDNDFLLTSSFLISSFIVGEVLQTISHLSFLEKLYLIFTKGQRPSEIFLLKDNPIVSGYFISKLTKYSDKVSNLKNYKNISLGHIVWGKHKESKICQDIFNEIYADVKENKSLQYSNAKYLFTRVLTAIFLFLSIIASIFGIWKIALLCGIIFLIFLYRTRGCANGLVRSAVILYSNKQ